MDEDERAAGRSRRVPMAMVISALLVVGILVEVAVYVFVVSDPEGGGVSDGGGCLRVRQVELAVTPEIYDVVVDALADVKPACTTAEPSERSGEEVARGVSLGGALPDIWIPQAHYLTTEPYLGPHAHPRLLVESLAQTPVLLVGGRSARRFPTWAEAESSGLVSVPDPETSVAGALAAVAPEAEAKAIGRTPAQAREALVPFAQDQGARRADGEDATVEPAMFPRRSPRLVVTTEQELVGVADRDDLRDLTPAVGAPVLDFPLVVAPRAAPGSRALARAIAEQLETEAGRAALNGHGLRVAGEHSLPGASTDATVALRTPPADAIFAAIQSWRTLAVPSAILAVVDASGSMDFDAGTGSRMDLLADAAGIGLSFLPDHARVGLWVFSIDKGGPGQDWRQLEPIRRLDDLRFGRTQRYALRQRAAQLSGLTGGGTGLYDTALAAYRAALRAYRPNYSNAVVLMTDGRNDDPGSIQLGALLQRLKELRDPDRPVRLVGVAISGDADLAALRQIARVTGGEAYLAAQPDDILEVFAQAVLSR